MIVGVDVSSRRIDLAYLDAEGKPQRWHQQLNPKAHLIDRLREIRVQWPNDIFPKYAGAGHGVTDVAIEYPFGRGNAIAALMATVGVITRQAPPWSRVAWPSSQELRAAIGAKNTKVAAHQAIWRMYREPDIKTSVDSIPAFEDYGAPWTSTLSTIGPHPLTGWDEHELDALTACVGWGRILASQDAA